MALEIPYTFAGFQSTNPSDPLPADQIDVCFAYVLTQIETNASQIADVRRSDGAIKNGSVTLDSLDAELQAKIGGTNNVTTADLDPNSYATTLEAEGGVATKKIMAPSTTKAAIEKFRAFAEQTDTQTAVSATLVMSPLRTKDLVDYHRAFADQATAEAGAEAGEVMSPLGTAQYVSKAFPKLKATPTIAFGTVAAGSVVTGTTPLAGAQVGDHVLVTPQVTQPAGLIFQGRVTVAGTVRVEAVNQTGASQTIGSVICNVTTLRI